MNYMYPSPQPAILILTVFQSPYARSVYITVTDTQGRSNGSYTILPPLPEEPEYYDVATN